MNATINDIEFQINSTQELSDYLDKLDTMKNAEAWLYSKNSQMLCLLKAESSMFLMYLKDGEDSGVISNGADTSYERISFFLSNGQEDEHPKSWCLEPELAYKGMAYFYENDGQRSPNISWSEE